MVIINVEADKSDTKAICDGSDILVSSFFQINLLPHCYVQIVLRISLREWELFAYNYS